MVDYGDNAIPSQAADPYDPLAVSQDWGSSIKYENSGYPYLQNLVANVILKKSTGNPEATISTVISPVPATKFDLDPFGEVVGTMLPFLIVIIYIAPVYNQVYLMVMEKESKARESMRMMGNTDFPYWLSWFTHFSLVNTVLSLICWGLLCINVVAWSNKGLVLLMFWLYGESLFGLIIFFQALFRRAKYAGLGAALIYFAGYCMFPIVSDPLTKLSTNVLCSFVPQISLYKIVKIFADYETTKIGLSTDTMSEMVYNYSFNLGCLQLIVNLVLWTALGLYLDKVLPKEYGERYPPWYIFTTRLWTCCKKKITANDQIDKQAVANDEEFETQWLDEKNYEPTREEVANLNSYLKINGLVKEYDNGFKAVNGINLKMYNNQIFALLGHNGAGKTTTISMLTGLLQKTQGSVQVLGKDLFNDMQSVR